MAVRTDLDTLYQVQGQAQGTAGCTTPFLRDSRRS